MSLSGVPNFAPGAGAYQPGRIEVVRAVDGPEYDAVLAIRRRVFVEEQGIVDTNVFDPDDERSIVALAYVPELGPNGVARRPVGTGRITLGYGSRGEALVAWVATLPEARRRGVATAIMRSLLGAADDAGASTVVLAAQIHAEAIYRDLGFVPAGRVYSVRGIDHRWMARPRP
ncbi:MAG TPA: GNAT family N-acetyltransferase [Thermomicrobiales bacterium]|nr:GNAT family N-acetyltransferase [Thermomicrobiales bacterium]